MRRDWGQGTCDVVIFEYVIESSSSAGRDKLSR